MNLITTNATPTGEPASIPAPRIKREREPFRIMPGWLVSDLTTVLEAQNAIAIVRDQIASIESQLADAEIDAREKGRLNADWLRRAQGALKIKKAGLEEIHARLAELSEPGAMHAANAGKGERPTAPTAPVDVALLLAEIDRLDADIIAEAKANLRARGVSI